MLPNPFLLLWNQPKSARGPAENRSLEEGKRLGRMKNVRGSIPGWAASSFTLVSE